MVAVTKQKAAPSIRSSSAKGDFEREKEVDDTMLDLLKTFLEGLEEDDSSSKTTNAGGGLKNEVVEEEPLGDKPLSVVTDAGENTLAKETKNKKRNVFTH